MEVLVENEERYTFEVLLKKKIVIIETMFLSFYFENINYSEHYRINFEITVE